MLCYVIVVYSIEMHVIKVKSPICITYLQYSA